MEIVVNEVVDGTYEVMIGGVDLLVDVEVEYEFDRDTHRNGAEKIYRSKICRGDLAVYLDETPIRISGEAEINIKRAINNYLYNE